MDVSEALQSATIKVRSKADPVTTLTDGTQSPAASDIAASFFHIDMPNLKQAEKLQDIYEFACEKGGDKDLDILNVMRDLRYRVGSPDLGETVLDKVHRYVKLRRGAQRLDAQAKAMEM